MFYVQWCWDRSWQRYAQFYATVWPLCVVAVNVSKRGAVIELIGQVDCSNRVALAIGLFESGNARSFFLDGLGLLPMAEYAIVWFADDVL
nr:hypothetical protein [Xylella fastidiosa]